LSYDHRVIDGGSAARFIVDLAAALQDFKEAAVKI
jgi:pyruvate/2-oxoglutarate dehydrogenase complex dihydrolipoamide acyltransferase (E2) component